MKIRMIGWLTILLAIITVSVTAFAHGGRTDSNDGHRDNKNRSGFGKYHYHCGGYPPHLHNDGVCQYKGNNSSLSGKVIVSTTEKIEKNDGISVGKYPEFSNEEIAGIGIVIVTGMVYLLSRRKK